MAYILVVPCYFCAPLTQAQLLNMKYFNGKHACAHCEEEGVPRPSCPRVRNWPYRGEAALRTLISNARIDITDHQPVSQVPVL